MLQPVWVADPVGDMARWACLGSGLASGHAAPLGIFPSRGRQNAKGMSTPPILWQVLNLLEHSMNDDVLDGNGSKHSTSVGGAFHRHPPTLSCCVARLPLASVLASSGWMAFMRGRQACSGMHPTCCSQAADPCCCPLQRWRRHGATSRTAACSFRPHNEMCCSWWRWGQPRAMQSRSR